MLSSALALQDPEDIIAVEADAAGPFIQHLEGTIIDSLLYHPSEGSCPNKELDLISSAIF